VELKVHFSRITVLLAVGILSGQHAIAVEKLEGYDPAEIRCKYADDTVIDTLLGEIDYADKALPNVPPEEERYLDAESARALRTYRDEEAKSDNSHVRSNQIYNRLFSRPFYAVWKFRKAFEPARSALSLILKPLPSNAFDTTVTYHKYPEAEKLQRASMAIYPVGDYVRALQEFLDKIEGRERSMMTESQYLQLVQESYAMNLDLGDYISCKLAKIMGRQTLDFK
jgi:hypothetical protein